MTPTAELEQRLSAEIDAVRQQVRAVQVQAEQSYECRRRRYRTFLRIAHRIRKLLQGRLEILARKIPFEARPSIMRGDHRYSGTVACHVPCDLAQVKFRFALAHDSDASHLLLDFELEILPIYVKFSPRENLSMPVDAYDEAELARWIDDRLVDFARVFLQLPLTEPYQREQIAVDPIANIAFPRMFARMTLRYEGKTYYFISDETCWEFERRHGIGVG